MSRGVRTLTTMKNTLCFLGCAAICGLSLSSCVVDPYGYPVAGGAYSSGPVGGNYGNGYNNSAYYGSGYNNPGYYGSGYSNANYYGSNYYNNGYGYGSPLYTPTLTSFSFFSGGNYGSRGGSRPVCNTSPYQGGHSYSRPVSSGHHHVTQPSVFPGGHIMSRPFSSPNLSVPRTSPHPSFQHSTPSFAPHTAPNRSFSVPSVLRPSGHMEHRGPAVQASHPMSAPSSVGHFAGVSSGHHRGH